MFMLQGGDKMILKFYKIEDGILNIRFKCYAFVKVKEVEAE